jgi:hypothetical protein
LEHLYAVTVLEQTLGRHAANSVISTGAERFRHPQRTKAGCPNLQASRPLRAHVRLYRDASTSHEYLPTRIAAAS